MSERYVQVPVSLIERAPHERTCDSFRWNGNGWGHDPAACDCWKAEAIALLAQQTPTAEPDRTPCAAETRSWDHFRPEQVDSYWITCDVLGPHDDHRDGHTGLTWRDEAAEPPSIDSMAPGTTFTAVIDGGALRSTFQRVDEEPPPYDGWIVGEPSTGHYFKPDAIDPSTIRDVTPPKGD